MHTKVIGIFSMLLSFSMFGQKEVSKHYTFRNNYPIVFNEDHSIKIDSSDNKWTSYKINNINPSADFYPTAYINNHDGNLRLFLTGFYKAKIFKDEYIDTKIPLYDYDNNYANLITNNPLIFPVPNSNENRYYIIYNRYNNFYRQPPYPTEGGFYYRIYDYEHNTLGEEKSIFNLNLNGGRIYGVLNPDPNKLNVVFLCNKTIKLYEINNCGFVFKDSLIAPTGIPLDWNPVSPNGNIIVHDFHMFIEPKPDQDVYYYDIDAAQGKIKQRYLDSKEFKTGLYWYSATGKHLFKSGFDDADPRKLIRYNVSLSTLDSIIASELVIPSQQFIAQYIAYGGYQYALYNQIIIPTYILGDAWQRGETYAYIIKDADAPNDVFLSDANIDTLRVKNLTDAELDCNSYFNSMNFYYNPAYRSPKYVNSGTPSLQVPPTRACVGTELQLQGSSFMKDSSRFVVYDPKWIVIVNDTGHKYSFVPDTSGTYKVQLLRSFACHTDTITQLIVVKPEISNILKPDSLHICMENTVNITAVDSLEQYSWNTGATTQSIVASEEGSYRVNAYNGCRSLNDSVWVAKSNPEPTNIVTPNGDRLNDHLVINGTKNMSFGLRVFNRWGIKVFESDKYQNNWPNDGNIDNGVYFFEISGDNCQTKGTVEVRKE
jgi:hypothetical protein